MKKLIIFHGVIFLSLLCNCCPGTNEQPRNNYFEFSIQTVLPGTPVAIFDKLTGNIKPWWDHSFSENPMKLYIEPKPGGGFYEIFDNEGNGVRHAVVTASDRGKLLRFQGPLGLAGKALFMVTTYKLTPAPHDSTQLTVIVHGSGEFDDSLPPVVEKVWKHFILERFKPYVEVDTFNKRIKP